MKIILLLSILVSISAAEMFELSPIQLNKSSLNKDTSRSRSVSMKKSSLIHQEKLIINLFDDTKIEAIIMSSKTDVNGVVSYKVSSKEATVLMSRINETLSINIHYKGDYYTVTGSVDSLLVEEKNIKKLQCNHSIVLPQDKVKKKFSKVLADGSKTTISIMFVYNQKAQDEAGSLENLLVHFTNTISDANTAFVNSGIDVEYVLVHSEKIADYTETNPNTALSDLAGESDGKLDTIHTIRETYKADLVCLISDVWNNDYAGLAYVGGETSVKSTGFSIVRYDQAISNHTFAHETGHNLGCGHDKDIAGAKGTYDYSYGYRWQGNDGNYYRSVMAYRDDGKTGETRVAWFSNPNQTHQGVATGTAIQDHAKTITNTKSNISSYYVSSSPTATDAFYYALDDYTISGQLIGSVPSGTITFAKLTDGTKGSAIINADGTFTYTSNASVSGDDTFTFSVSDGADSATATVTVHIYNAAVLLWIDVLDGFASEPDSNASIKINKINKVATAVSVLFENTGTATENSDYTLDLVSISASETEKTVSINIVDDSTIESPETILLNIKSSASYTVVPNTKSISVNDDDSSGGSGGGNPIVVEGRSSSGCGLGGVAAILILLFMIGMRIKEDS